MKLLERWCTLICVLCACSAFAEEQAIPEIVISAARTPQAGADVASAVTVITREELASGKYPNVAETLRGVVGLDVAQSGPQSAASIFIRGARSEHTLVLVDGVDVSHPGLNGRAADLTHMNIDDVERIEVVRGPQSVLFGSNAIGGVINVITKRAEGTHATVRLTAGNYGTLEEHVSASFKQEAYHAQASMSEARTKGISAANEKDGNKEADASHFFNVGAGFGYDDRIWNAAFDWRLEASANDLDNFGGPGGDDPNYTATQRADLATLSLGHAWSAHHMTQLKTSRSWYTHHFDNRPDAAHPFASDDTSLAGTRLKTEIQHDARLGEHTLSVGAEQQLEEASSRSRLILDDGTVTQSDIPRTRETNHAYFIQDVWKQEFLTLTAGLRRDEFAHIAGATTHRITALVPLGEALRLKGSYGTAFNAPSIPQRYGFGGNRALKPERSRGWDAGLASDGAHVGMEATYFENTFEDMIDYDFTTNLFGNIARANSRGLETALWSEVGALRAESRYTLTHTEDAATGAPLLRRPKDKFQASLTWRPTHAWMAHLAWQKMGRRRDVAGNVPGYELLNVKTAYFPTDTSEVFLRVDNALDEHYEEVDGYGTYGRRYYGGMALTL